MILEQFHENSFSTSFDAILLLIRGNSRVNSPSGIQIPAGENGHNFALKNAYFLFKISKLQRAITS